MASRSFRLHLIAAFFMACLGYVIPVAAATKVQTAGIQYQVDKTPAWVEKVPGSTSQTVNVQGNGSIQVLLSDTQVNLLGPKPATYMHGKSIALERSGLEGVSSIRIQFNPRFENLTLHELAIFRDGKRIDRLKTARIDLAQRERRLDEGIYDEDVEAIIALNDVRIGDTVEYGYTLAGDNPIFGGRYSSFFILNRDQPVARLAVRIHYPANRKFHFRLYRSELSFSESQEQSVRKMRLDAEGLAPVRLEPAVPPWVGQYPWLQVSEYGSWEEVGAWARGLYAVPTDLSPEIEGVLERIKAAARSPEEQVAMTLAWVQNEIRYYSLIVGTSSHRPNHPNLTVRQRFGDCKDKSLLLASMLRRLGIQAEPALVSSQARRRVADFLPTHQAFDHVIVRTQLGDQTYWLDGTRTYQGSALSRLGFVNFGKALVVTDQPARELSDVVAPAESRSGTEVTETFRVEKYGNPVAMILEQKFLGSFAEWFRNESSAKGVKRAMEPILSDYGKDFPNIAPQGEARIADDPVENILTVTQAFSIPQLFTYEGGRAKMASVYARSIVPWLKFPGSPERRHPLALPFPGTFSHNIVLEAPHKLPTNVPPPENWQDRHYALNTRLTVDDRKAAFSYSAKVLQDHVAAADFPAFSEKFPRGSAMLFSSISVPIVDGSQMRNRLVRDFERARVNVRDPDQLDNYQQKFLRDHAYADESIRSGLLSGALLAKALKDRAEAASLLGRRQEALADVMRSLELEASDGAQVLKGEIQLYSGNYREALETLKAVTQDKDKTNTQIAAAMANYFLGNYGEARQGFAKAAEGAGSEELPYSLLWLALAEMRAGRGAEEAISQHASRLGTAWPSQAVAFMQGKLSPEQLIAAARQDSKESRLRLCEAYFYLGQKSLLEGDAADARRWFGKAVETRAVMYREHIFSQQELQKLATP